MGINPKTGVRTFPTRSKVVKKKKARRARLPYRLSFLRGCFNP